MIKAEFSASLLQSSVSHDPSEIILIDLFAAQETFFFYHYYYKYLKQLSNFFQDSFNEYKDQKISIYLK